ncbi:MAG: ATP-dependent zinc protease [Pseudomonadaceae bacterium]|jgi:hypothetical protein|nr:ATP-dependent zinc protease [Pseudomonadaceae bacterium]
MKAFLLLFSLVTLPVLAAEPTLYGRYERIGLPELNTSLKAKMDTGANTASLSARDIQLFKRDGEAWVRFRLAAEDADDTLYEHSLARISKIKKRADEGDDEPSGADVSKRPVIDLQLCLGDQLRTVEVNLTDRSSFNYPLLIGAKALRELDAAIDPAKRFTAGKPSCK